MNILLGQLRQTGSESFSVQRNSFITVPFNVVDYKENILGDLVTSELVPVLPTESYTVYYEIKVKTPSNRSRVAIPMDIWLSVNKNLTQASAPLYSYDDLEAVTTVSGKIPINGPLAIGDRVSLKIKNLSRYTQLQFSKSKMILSTGADFGGAGPGSNGWFVKVEDTILKVVSDSTLEFRGDPLIGIALQGNIVKFTSYWEDSYKVKYAEPDPTPGFLGDKVSSGLEIGLSSDVTDAQNWKLKVGNLGPFTRYDGTTPLGYIGQRFGDEALLFSGIGVDEQIIFRHTAGGQNDIIIRNYPGTPGHLEMDTRGLHSLGSLYMGPSTFITFEGGSNIGFDDFHNVVAGTDWTDDGVVVSARAIDERVIEPLDDMQVYGFMDQLETTLSFDGTSIFTLAPTGTYWSYYRAGIKYTISGSKTINLLTVDNPLVDGAIYYIYIDSIDGTLSASRTPWTLLDTKVPVALLLWNNAMSPKYWIGEERHTCLITRRTHYYLHTTQGCKPNVTGALAGYFYGVDTNAAKTFSIGNSVIEDEDIRNIIDALSEPDGTATDYLVFYRTGISTWNWKDSNMPFPYNIGNTNNKVQIDNAGTMTNASSFGNGALTRWVNSYVLFTNFKGKARFIILPGQNEYTSLSAAIDEDPHSFDLTGLPIVETVIAWQLTWSTQTSTSQGLCQLVNVKMVGTATDRYLSSVIFNSISDVDFIIANGTDILGVDFSHTHSFLNLTDTPSSYSGQGLKGVRVNSGATGLEFYTTTSGTVTGTGVAGRVAYWTGTSALGSEAGFEYNATSNILTVPRIYTSGISPLTQDDGATGIVMDGVSGGEGIYVWIADQDHMILSPGNTAIYSKTLVSNYSNVSDITLNLVNQGTGTAAQTSLGFANTGSTPQVTMGLGGVNSATYADTFKIKTTLPEGIIIESENPNSYIKISRYDSAIDQTILLQVEAGNYSYKSGISLDPETGVIIEGSSVYMRGYANIILNSTDVYTGILPRELTDVDKFLVSDTNNQVKYVTGSDLLTFIGGSTVTTFLGLTDTPSSYTSQKTKILRVKDDESGVEFYPETALLSSFYTTTTLINSAISATGIKNVFIDSVLTLTTDWTIPAGVTLFITRGGYITGAFTVTGNETVIDAPAVKVFDTSTLITGTWKSKTGQFLIEWCGALSDQSTDISIATNKTLRAFGSAYLNGLYLIEDTIDIYRWDSVLCSPKTEIIWDSNGADMFECHEQPFVLDGGDSVIYVPETGNYGAKFIHLNFGSSTQDREDSYTAIGRYGFTIRNWNAFGYNWLSSGTTVSGSTFTNNAAAVLTTGRKIRIVANDGSTLPAPLTENTVYYAIRLTSVTYQVALTEADALAGTNITLIDAGTGTFSLFHGMSLAPDGIVADQDTPRSVVTFDSSTNILTHSVPNIVTGTPVGVVKLAGGVYPTATGVTLSPVTKYYAIYVSDTTCKLATSLANSMAGTAIDFLTNGSGTLYLFDDTESSTCYFAVIENINLHRMNNMLVVMNHSTAAHNGWKYHNVFLDAAYELAIKVGDDGWSSRATSHDFNNVMIQNASNWTSIDVTSSNNVIRGVFFDVNCPQAIVSNDDDNHFSFTYSGDGGGTAYPYVDNGQTVSQSSFANHQINNNLPFIGRNPDGSNTKIGEIKYDGANFAIDSLTSYLILRFSGSSKYQWTSTYLRPHTLTASADATLGTSGQSWKTLYSKAVNLYPGAAPTATEGAMYQNSTDHKLYYHNGTAWVALEAASVYTHPAYTPISLDTSGAQVIDTFSTDAIGSVTGITTRNLTLADIGYNDPTVITDNQIAVGTGSGIAGDANFTWDGTTQIIVGNVRIGNSGSADYKFTVREGTNGVIGAAIYNTSISSSLDAGAQLVLGDDNTANQLTLRQSGDGSGHNSHIIHNSSTASAGLIIESSTTSGSVYLNSNGYTGIQVDYLGYVLMPNIPAGVSDYDKFMVMDSSTIKYRTGAQVLLDISAQPKFITGTVATAAATAAKTVTISGYTLAAGDMLAITFTLGNSAAAMTLNINGTVAIELRMNNITTNTTFATLAAGTVIMLFFDGTYFQMMGSQRTSDTDTNTYDRMYWNNACRAGAAIYDYKIIMFGTDGKVYPLTLEEGTGTTKTVSTQAFKIDSPALYYATTTNIAANATVSNVYSEYPVANMTYTFNQATWTAEQFIYLKGTIVSGNFVLDNTSYTSFATQTVPTSEDGFVYKLLGYAYSTTAMRLFIQNPLYEYKAGKFRPYGLEMTTINNNANNRIITGSGTANTLEAEATFTYDGSGRLRVEVPTGSPFLDLWGGGDSATNKYGTITLTGGMTDEVGHSAPTAGDTLGLIMFGSNFNYDDAGSIRVTASGTHSSTNHGGIMSFSTIRDGSTVNTEAIQIDATTSVIINPEGTDFTRFVVNGDTKRIIRTDPAYDRVGMGIDDPLSSVDIGGSLGLLRDAVQTSGSTINFDMGDKVVYTLGSVGGASVAKLPNATATNRIYLLITRTASNWSLATYGGGIYLDGTSMGLTWTPGRLGMFFIQSDGTNWYVETLK